MRFLVVSKEWLTSLSFCVLAVSVGVGFGYVYLALLNFVMGK